jgi:hypothetical protein
VRVRGVGYKHFQPPFSTFHFSALIGMTLTKHAQAFAMASRTLGAGSAQIAVPAIVGALADPCKRFGWRRGCGQGGFFKERPFALCAFFIASTGVVATITNFFMIPNVRTRRVDGRSVVIAAPASGGGLFGRKPQKQADVPSSEPDSALPSVTTESKRSTSLPASVKPPPSAFGSSDAAPESAPGSKLPSLTGGRSPDPPPASPPFRRFASMPATAFTRTASALGNARESLRALPRSRTFARTRSMLSQTSSTLDKTLSGWGRDAFASGIIEGDTDLDAAMAAASAVRERRRALKMASGELVLPPPLPPTDAETAAPAKPTPWWRHRPALLSIAAYAAVTFLFDAYYDLVNLYGSAPHDAKIPGLALPVTKLSWMQSLGGACVVLFSVLAYPHIQRRIGVSNCARAGLAAGIPTALVPPTAFYTVPKPAAVLGILAVSQMLYGCAMALTSTSSQILTNLCAPSGSIGAVNGAGNMLSSLSRVLEPTVVGALWALAASDSFPDQVRLVGRLKGKVEQSMHQSKTHLFITSFPNSVGSLGRAGGPVSGHPDAVRAFGVERRRRGRRRRRPRQWQQNGQRGSKNGDEAVQ